MIDKQRVRLELHALADITRNLAWDLDDGWIEIKSLPLPDGWNRESLTVHVELPEYYPGGWPKLFVPDDLRFDGKRPEWLLPSGPDGWSRYDHHRFGRDPEFNTVVSLLRMLNESVKNPDDPAVTQNST